ncbi:SDR family oxidoreductase [Thiolapillus sp.]|uniref:SDR family oxidoreductase n=1 Tax=Thiolapillus sp. TaxID=2017437 RepID=UPI003AF7DC26
MDFKNTRILFVGAAGGIGSYMAEDLLAAGARVCLVGLFEEELEHLTTKLGDLAKGACSIVADVTRGEDRARCVQVMQESFGGVDMLINLAGINAFARFEEQSEESIEKIMSVNAIAPMLMAHAVLPDMLKQGGDQIVNIGSTFGSIGFSCFTSYSTSKFALRGFSQALRRELVDTGVGVTYIAPRGVDTPLNPPAVYEMAKEVKMSFDQPEYVADQILDAIRKDRKEKYIGFPESLFARVNGVFPGLVDNSLRKQNTTMKKYAEQDGNR